MKDYIRIHPWEIREEGWNPQLNRVSESLFSIGNGRMGQRGNPEEDFSGDTLPGSYIGGVYYPDKTRVGWWKNGYPEYFAKVLNSLRWQAISLKVNGFRIDLGSETCQTKLFRRTLNMQEGWLGRLWEFVLPDGTSLRIESKRCCHMEHKDLGVLQYRISADRNIQVEADVYLDANVRNQDANYDEVFWENHSSGIDAGNMPWLSHSTRKTGFQVLGAQRCQARLRGKELALQYHHDALRAGAVFTTEAAAGEVLEISKYAAILSDLHHAPDQFLAVAGKLLQQAEASGAEALFESQAAAWARIWQEADMQIDGDDAAQQGIRFNIFQLFQTYTGDDARLNIGPKGFTGEKYGGSTYWDTEAYCLPFYLGCADASVSRNLLLYRYKQLDKAIENAQKLGFGQGAALYPMVTMNGEECHNEWEITFEEIHRNGAIAYGIYDYVRYTGDAGYIPAYGLEVLIGIARFWAQRVNWSKPKGQWVMLGVTGPNEFENNVNNNWYTNYLAAWCLRYAAEQAEWVKSAHPADWQRISEKVQWKESEMERWNDIASNMYYPVDSESGLYLQQDGFMDKELIPVSELSPAERPIVEHWSWDRILRSCYIKQADVLQGFYFFEDDFDRETLRRHYHFYEPLTVHESSLSPCVHSILAVAAGLPDKAYEFYLRTARLDLNDINNDTRDGCHITSMAGTWMTIAKGFAGMRVRNQLLHFEPSLPAAWQRLAFQLRFRGNVLRIELRQGATRIENREGGTLRLVLAGQEIEIPAGSYKELSA
jgi:maltose phosphorylase